MTTSIFVDYHYLLKDLRLKILFLQSAHAQGKTSDHLDFALTYMSISLWLVKYLCFGRKACQSKIWQEAEVPALII